MITEEDLWYFKTTGFYKVRETLPSDLVDRLNEVTSRQIADMREPIVWEEKEAIVNRKMFAVSQKFSCETPSILKPRLTPSSSTPSKASSVQTSKCSPTNTTTSWCAHPGLIPSPGTPAKNPMTTPSSPA